jgi:hypothetical protein
LNLKNNSKKKKSRGEIARLWKEKDEVVVKLQYEGRFEKSSMNILGSYHPAQQ